MKTKKENNKLKFNTNSITDLNRQELLNVFGGTTSVSIVGYNKKTILL